MNGVTLERPAAEPMTAHLIRAAEQARMQLFNLQRGQFHLSWGFGRGCTLQFSRAWLTATDPRPLPAGADHLAAHADWSGPARYERNGATLASLSLPLGDVHAFLFHDADGAFDLDSERLLADVLGRIPDWLRGVSTGEWSPPEAEQLVEWLAVAGHTAVGDDEGGLRLTLARRSCDGFVKVERRTDRLRFSLRLGAWQQLGPGARAAMHRLIQSANHRGRMVRHIWREDDGISRAEAVVDFTGLPLPTEGEPLGAGLWTAALPAALDGLQLSLDRLGLELDALADPRHSDLVEAFNARAE